MSLPLEKHLHKVVYKLVEQNTFFRCTHTRTELHKNTLPCWFSILFSGQGCAITRSSEVREGNLSSSLTLENNGAARGSTGVDSFHERCEKSFKVV